MLLYKVGLHDISFQMSYDTTRLDDIDFLLPLFLESLVFDPRSQNIIQVTRGYRIHISNTYEPDPLNGIGRVWKKTGTHTQFHD